MSQSMFKYMTIAINTKDYAFDDEKLMKTLNEYPDWELISAVMQNNKWTRLFFKKST